MFLIKLICAFSYQPLAIFLPPKKEAISADIFCITAESLGGKSRNRLYFLVRIFTFLFPNLTLGTLTRIGGMVAGGRVTGGTVIGGRVIRGSVIGGRVIGGRVGSGIGIKLSGFNRLSPHDLRI